MTDDQLVEISWSTTFTETHKTSIRIGDLRNAIAATYDEQWDGPGPWLAEYECRGELDHMLAGLEDDQQSLDSVTVDNRWTTIPCPAGPQRPA